MLKNNELRIGNICQWSEFSKIGNGQFTISLGNLPFVKDMNPIWLTDEWFIKFGFKRSGGYWYHYIDDYHYCFREGNKKWSFSIEYTDDHSVEDFKKYFVSSGIEYVHQLQNLWFSLTQTELKGHN